MYYGNIKYCDISNGEGIRTSLFVSGCRLHCKGCFQPETWDFCYGNEFTEETLNIILDSLKPFYIKGITILGGDPFEPENQEEIINIIRKIKDTYIDKDIWMYTGYTLEYLLKHKTTFTDEILCNIDTLVDGPFKEELKIPKGTAYKGSLNQRIMNREQIFRIIKENA